MSTSQVVPGFAGFAGELGIETFVVWPREEPVDQLERFAREVAPGVREAVAA